MALEFRPLHPLFAAEVGAIELRQVEDRATLEAIRAAMDKYAVLVFRDQPFTDAEQLAFAQRFDGKLHSGTGAAVLGKNRFGNEALTDISNVDETGGIMRSDDRRRAYGLGNRLWHTDASFQDPPGRYSMLHARVVPPVAADTQFADMRGGVRRARARDPGAGRRAARAPLNRLLAPDARLRVVGGRAGAAQRRRASARAH